MLGIGILTGLAYAIRTTTACIFKVGDDCRQDVLALQVIRLLQDSLKKAGVDLFLAPYGVIPTGQQGPSLVPGARGKVCRLFLPGWTGRKDNEDHQ